MYKGMIQSPDYYSYLSDLFYLTFDLTNVQWNSLLNTLTQS